MNKSEELAKLLGIEPINKGDYLVYPDFTKPNNFVKIMTLAHKAGCFVCCGTEYRDGDIMQDCFLDLIIQDISDESYKQDWAKEYVKIRNKFIKQAQQADWEC